MLIRPHLSPADNRRIQAMLFGNQNGDLRQQLLDGAPFLAELTHTAVPQRAAPGTTGTFTRATTATVKDHEGVLRTAIAGEARFEGARRVRNLAGDSNDLNNAYFTKNNAGTGILPVVTSNYAADPIDGVVRASRLVLDIGAGTGAGDVSRLYMNGGTIINNCSTQFRAKSNTANSYVVDVGGGAVNRYVTITPEWQLFAPSVFTSYPTIMLQGGTACSQYADISVCRYQNEDITGRADQTTPSEYVSVGVTSAPYYHGSMVDGVKCFPTDLSGNPIPAATMLGYQAEGARTNLCLQSNAFTTTWTTSGTVTSAQNAGGPSGAANEAWTLGDTDAAVLSDFRQEFVIANDAVLRGYQIRVEKTVGAATFPGVGVLLLGGTTVAGQWAVNTNLGTLTARSSNVGTVAATIESAGNFWLIKTSATNNSTGNVTARIQMFPAVNADASATWVASTVGTAVFAYAGFEVGWPSSYIATTTVAVARNADVLTYSSAGNAITAACSIYVEASRVGAGAAELVIVSDGSSDNAYELTSQGYAGEESQGVIRSGGAVYMNTVVGTATLGTTGKYGFTGTTNSGNAYFNGAAATLDTSVTVPASLTTIQIGDRPFASIPWFGNIGPVYIWQRQLSASELQAITS